jgi:hypothetical protein
MHLDVLAVLAFAIFCGTEAKTMSEWDADTHQLFTDFYDAPKTFKAAMDLEAGKSITNSTLGLRGLMPDGTSIFTKFEKDPSFRKNAVIHDTGLGFEVLMNSRAPYPSLYSDPEQAGISALHFFLIPKETKYNAVTLTKDDIPMLKSMMSYSKHCFAHPKCLEMLITMQRKAFKDEVNRLTLDNSTLCDIEHTFERDMNAIILGDKERGITSVSGEDLAFALHLHDQKAEAGRHSIGHLNVHAFIDLPALRTSHLHDHKNTPVDSVINILNMCDIAASRKAAVEQTQP